MTNVTVIILVGREELHLRRCLERLAPLCPRRVLVVESQTGDRTHEIAIQMGAETVFHPWPGNQAAQFNWALNEVAKTDGGGWVLRLDADEYLTSELIAEIREKLPRLADEIEGVVLKRRHYFGGGWAKHGTYPVKILRLFRLGKGRYASKQLMDERIEVKKAVEFDFDFIDHTLISMNEWRAKHRDYARREAAQAFESMRTGVWVDSRKARYYRLPPYIRAVLYFCMRYFLKGGFLDGYAGWMWNFWQGLWYRWVVDRELAKLRRSS